MRQVARDIQVKAEAPLADARRAGWEAKAKEFLFFNLADKVSGVSWGGGGVVDWFVVGGGVGVPWGRFDVLGRPARRDLRSVFVATGQFESTMSSWYDRLVGTQVIRPHANLPQRVFCFAGFNRKSVVQQYCIGLCLLLLHTLPSVFSD